MLADAGGTDRRELVKKLCIVGTCVKRRCNLKLIEQQNGEIAAGEIRLSLEDTVNTLNTVGIASGLEWQPEGEISSSLSLKVLDTIEQLMEEKDFRISALDIMVRKNVLLKTIDNGRTQELVLSDGSAAAE